VAKKIKTVVRLQIEAGKANPAPPIGPALAPHGINLMVFCKEYNARTSSRPGDILPAEITIYTDGSFTFILKTPPTPVLLRKAGYFTGFAGNYTQLEDSIRSFEEICAGKWDQLPEQAFMYVGTTEDAAERLTAKEKPDRNGNYPGGKTGSDHLMESCGGSNFDASGGIRFRCSFHDAGNLTELSAYFLDDAECGLSNSFHGM
jgi:hypothetical protein